MKNTHHNASADDPYRPQGKRGMLAVLALVFTLCILLAAAVPPPSARAEDGDTVDYVGGKISYTPYRTRALLDELEIAYITCDSPYLLLGQTANWTISIAGGDGDYQCKFLLCYQAFNNSTSQYSGLSLQGPSSTKTFSADITESGRYFIQVTVTDSAGATLVWQSPIYVSATENDLELPTTVAGKVRALVEACLVSGAYSEYEKALWAHDWLVQNAEYDMTFQNVSYHPDGVLLYGRGVCQSYALAYQMLLHELGVECLYVTGIAGGGGHAWNMVRIGGAWFHVDCTWDDPVNGSPNYSYFCITDEMMAIDHTWSTAAVMPQCDTVAAFTNAGEGATIQYQDVATLEAQLTIYVGMRKSMLTIFYTGSDTTHNLREPTAAWLEQNKVSMNIESYTFDEYYLNYVYIDYLPSVALPERITLQTDAATLAPGQEMAIDAVVLPRTADQTVTWSSDNTAVAVIRDGRVLGVAPGQATLTASAANGVYAQCAVRVTEGDDTLGLLYRVHDGEAIITGYIGNAGALDIPSAFNGLPIIAVADGAFSSCARLTSIKMPDSLRLIGDGAFIGCEALVRVQFGNALYAISDDAFTGLSPTLVCYPDSYALSYANARRFAHAWITDGLLDIAVFYPPRQTIYALGETFNPLDLILTLRYQNGSEYMIDDGYVADDTALHMLGAQDLSVSVGAISTSIAVTVVPDRTLHLPNALSTLAAEAFYDNDVIGLVYIGASLTSIGERAFMGCDLLTTVYVPDTVTTIGADAFASCPMLTIVCSEGSAAQTYAVQNNIPHRAADITAP